ncbi:hypothetical protein FOCC_FOCC000701 [Frankliniella occidentalis]|nr:hypothetical protein FOCC_FOCC000701 [Frankliniella occidentalis]
MLSALLPDEWPNTLAKDKKFSVTLSLPPFTDCTFRLVAALWADVMLVNLSVLWESGGADAPTTTYSLALPVGEYVVEDVARARPQLQNISRLAESVKTVLSRPAMCAARTAHAVVNPSLLGLPLRAARRVLACLPVADLCRLAACCRALHALTTDPVLWRYTLTRDFGPLALTQGALTVGEGVPQAGQDAVDWRAEYKRLYRQRSALQIRRPSSDCRYCLPGLPLRPPPLHDSVHSFHRQQLQQLQLQSTSSLGLIREDNGVSPEDGASSPPPEVQPPLRVQGQQPLSLQSFYSSSAAAAAAPPRRTRSSKSTTSRASSVASHHRALRRAQPAPATEEVVKVGSKVYKALVGAVTKSSAVTTTAPSQVQRKTCVDRRKHGFYDSDDKFHSAEFDNPSIASSRASSSRSRSFCKVSSGSRRGSFSLSGSFMKKSATRKQQPPPPAAQTALPEAAPSSSPTKRAESQPTKTPAESKDPESRPRSRTRRGLGAAACSPPNLSLSEHRPYAPADDPNYERLLTTTSSPIKTQATAEDPSAPPARPRAAPSKAAPRPASHRRQSSASALHRSAPRAATKAGRPADCSAET